MTVADIKRAIESLSDEERAHLADWFAEQDAAAWDAEIERDFSPGGRGANCWTEWTSRFGAGKRGRCRKDRQNRELFLFRTSRILEVLRQASSAHPTAGRQEGVSAPIARSISCTAFKGIGRSPLLFDPYERVTPSRAIRNASTCAAL